MPRLQKIAPETATGATKDIYEGIKKSLGSVPNIFQGLGNSPAALSVYLQAGEILGKGNLSGVEREVIALTVAQANGCDYCLAAHTAIAGMHGVKPDQTVQIRKFQSENPKYNALSKFTKEILETKGFVKDSDLEDFKKAGYSDAQIPEVVMGIALNVFTNYFNHINQTVVDFPKAPAL